MKRKIISTLLALVGLIIIGFATLLFLGVFKEQQAGILIESEPIANVYINSQKVGKTPYETSMEYGQIIVQLIPDQIENIILDNYEIKINLVPGVRTIIKRSFADTEEYSSGAVVSFEKLGGIESYVAIVSAPDSAQVLIDGKAIGFTPLKVKVPAGDHNLVVMSDKYLERPLPIRVYKGYKLTASVKLEKEKKKEVEEQLVKQKEKDLSLGRIKINKTDVGFLRVRSGANTGFPEIGQVKPDEEYDVLEEGENGKWYKIKIGEISEAWPVASVEGWVSAEFVTKI